MPVTPQLARMTGDDATGVSAENPWPGLLSFREADQHWFQGRSEEILELLQHVKRERLTVLFALSGLGKSSLLQAGLFPALRLENIFPVYIRLDHTIGSPSLRAQLLDTLLQAGAMSGIQVPWARPEETLWEYFHNLENEFWSTGKRRVLPLLVFDQFEEIFTLGKDAARAQTSESFLDELADLAEDRMPASVAQRFAANPDVQDNYAEEGDYKVLISLREDFLPELSDQHRRIALVPHKRYRLRQMNGEGSWLAVSQAKELVDETVAAQIVRYVAAGERLGGGGRGRPLKELDVEPALLSVVCRELNNRRRERGEPKISADLLEGSQEQVLNDFYARSLEGMTPAVRTFVEEQLITVAGARNSVALEDAEAAPGMSDAIIEQLVDRRLLRKEYRRNEVRIELTHDLLTGVVRASRDLRRNEEAVEKQRREREEALAELRRTRKITLGFACVAIVAVIAAVVAYQADVRANAQTRRAEEARRLESVQRQRATEEQARATEQAKIAREKEQERAQEAVRADDEAKNARTAAEQARRNETLANEQRVEAEKQRKAADSERSVANQQRALAQKSEKDAEQSAADARTQQQAAEKARADTVTANRQLAVQNDQIQKEVAKSLVSEAVGLVQTRQFGRSLGDVARALVLDSGSLAARSLAFDQLLRGGWGPLPDQSQNGAAQFVHPDLNHPAGVLFAVFDPSGQHVATTCRDGKVRLWDWRSGTAVELGTHPDATSAAFSPDGHLLVTASLDQTARVWDVGKRSQLFELRHTSRVVSAMFSRDGRLIVTASQDRTAQVWNAASGAKVGASLNHPMTVNFAAFSPDAGRVATACADGRARVWDLATAAEVFEVQHQSEVKSAAFSPDGNLLVTASSDGTARIWDTRSHLLVGDPLQHAGPVYFASFSADSRRIATASKDGTSRIWEAASGRPITAPLGHKGAVLSALLSGDGHRMVSASDDKTARVWEVWYDFENPQSLITALEGIGGYDSAQADIPQLPDAERRRRLADLQARMTQQGSNGFLRWLFVHRQLPLPVAASNR